MAQRVDYHRCAKPRASLCKAFLRYSDLRDVLREEMGSSVNVAHESETPSASGHSPAKLAGKEVVTDSFGQLFLRLWNQSAIDKEYESPAICRLSETSYISLYLVSRFACNEMDLCERSSKKAALEESDSGNCPPATRTFPPFRPSTLSMLTRYDRWMRQKRP